MEVPWNQHSIQRLRDLKGCLPAPCGLWPIWTCLAFPGGLFFLMWDKESTLG